MKLTTTQRITTLWAQIDRAIDLRHRAEFEGMYEAASQLADFETRARAEVQRLLKTL
jgi:hypothetical protein